jgi:DNA-binding transcriptional regulator YiaG
MAVRVDGNTPTRAAGSPQFARQGSATIHTGGVNPPALQGRRRAAASPTVPVPAATNDSDRGLVGRRIVAAREHDGLSQRQLAARLGIDRRQLSEWERGCVEPYPKNLRRLALALARPMEYFLDEHEPC